MSNYLRGTAVLGAGTGLGFDMSTVMPYMSAVTSAFGSKKDDPEAARRQDEDRRRQEEARRAAEAHSRHVATALWIVGGVLGAAALGTGGYFLFRHGSGR